MADNCGDSITINPIKVSSLLAFIKQIKKLIPTNDGKGNDNDCEYFFRGEDTKKPAKNQKNELNDKMIINTIISNIPLNCLATVIKINKKDVIK